jgi:hypothetical protein
VEIRPAKLAPLIYGRGRPRLGRRDLEREKERGKGKIKREAEEKGSPKVKGKTNRISGTLAPDSLRAAKAPPLPLMASAIIGQEEMVTASMVLIATLSMRDHKEEASARTLSPLF